MDMKLVGFFLVFSCLVHQGFLLSFRKLSERELHVEDGFEILRHKRQTNNSASGCPLCLTNNIAIDLEFVCTAKHVLMGKLLNKKKELRLTYDNFENTPTKPKVKYIVNKGCHCGLLQKNWDVLVIIPFVDQSKALTNSELYLNDSVYMIYTTIGDRKYIKKHLKKDCRNEGLLP